MHEMERRPARSTDAASIVVWFPARAEAVLWGGPNVPDPLTSPWLEQEFESTGIGFGLTEPERYRGFRACISGQGLLRLARFALSPGARARIIKRLVEETIALADLSALDSFPGRVWLQSNRQARLSTA